MSGTTTTRLYEARKAPLHFNAARQRQATPDTRSHRARQPRAIRGQRVPSLLTTLLLIPRSSVKYRAHLQPWRAPSLSRLRGKAGEIAHRTQRVPSVRRLLMSSSERHSMALASSIILIRQKQPAIILLFDDLHLHPSLTQAPIHA
jgi:hypothetical protein